MKIPAFTALLLLASAPLFATGASLTVKVEGVQNAQGKVRFQLFNSEAGWLSQTVRTAERPASPGSMEVTFPDLPTGDYGVFVYQDNNGDGTLNTNALGIPREPFAFSNNAQGMFGPAKWAQARFSVGTGAATTTIRL